MRQVIAEILLDQALEKPLDYLLPDHLEGLEIGSRVEVPLQNKLVKGTVFGLKGLSPYAGLKSVHRAIGDVPLFPPDLFRLAQWIATYYCAPLNRVLKSLLPPVVREEKVKPKTQFFVKGIHSLESLRQTCENLRKKYPSQARVLDLLLQSPQGLFLSELLEKGDFSMSPIKTLVKNGVIELKEVDLDRSSLLDQEFFPTKPKVFNEEQQKAYKGIIESLGSFKTHLIHGVTGSGKTEVYLQAIDAVLKRGESVLYLVPEIALTSQTIERFRGRFGKEKIALLHHRLSQGERHDGWHNIRMGKVKIAIGARSAIFSPFQNLGLIIVDEEHEASYKQSEEGPKYHARDVAVVRGKFANCPVLLGSATPSIESYANALSGKYQLHTLKQRADSALLPKVDLIDMNKEFDRAKGFVLFSDPLIGKIEERLKLGEQTLLFLNRRGYHTSAQCPHCAHTIHCPHCELSLTYHLGDNFLACHLCDHRISPPRQCPKCQADGPLKFKGVGTELVEKSLHALFPQVRTLRLDADTTRHKGSHEKIFKSFRSGKADVLIGTQMIAKGLHFPLVTLVGVLGVDGSLNIPDFRASENVFQLLTQVAGRSGRGPLKGEVCIQTHLPDHPIIRHASHQDYESFYAEEIQVRQLFGYPPFTHLVKCSFSSDELASCEEYAKSFRQKLIASLPRSVEIHPVIPCGYAKIKGRYRFQCLIKVEKIQQIVKKLENLRKQGKGEVRMTLDVDPLTTFF